LSEEIKIDNKKLEIEEFIRKYAPNGYYFMKCKCGIFTTDYPFISQCCKCGYKLAGASEDHEKWKKEGILIEILDPKDVSAKKRAELINEYEASGYDEDYNDDLYEEDDYEDIMGVENEIN